MDKNIPIWNLVLSSNDFIFSVGRLWKRWKVKRRETNIYSLRNRSEQESYCFHQCDIISHDMDQSSVVAQNSRHFMTST